MLVKLSIYSLALIS